MDDNKVPFQVVRGLEKSILNSSHSTNGNYPEGMVYFATDTRKIYYGNGTSVLTPMGGNSDIWYGNMQYSETPEEDQVDFTFYPEDIEGNAIPNPNDLIFNTPDKSFYRVLDLDEGGTAIYCRRLAVAGGGGGGTGGGGSSANVGTMTLSRINSQTLNVLQGQSCEIKFRFIAQDAAGEFTKGSTYSLYVRGILKDSGDVEQGENSIDVGPYLEPGANAIRLVVNGEIGTTTPVVQTKTWSVNVTNLTLTWNYDETTINRDDNFTFDWRVSTFLEHTIYIVIDQYSTITIPSSELGTGTDKTYTISRSEWNLNHGSHEIEMYAEINIDGQAYSSDKVSHVVICVDEDRSDTIIAIKTLPSLINQYDTLSIPIIIYDPVSGDGKISATLRENGVDKDKWTNYLNGNLYYWNYTPIESGDKTLSILSGTAEKSIRVEVQNLGLQTQEVSGYDFKFKASDIISNNNLQNWSYGNIVPSFSDNFDWTNGGLKSEFDKNNNLQNYIAIKAGDRLSFNYSPFATDKKGTGFTLKVIFKATACRNYDATVLTIGSATEQDKVFLHLKANEGIFQANGEKALTIPYCENQYIEFEIDIWPYNETTPYLMSWLDGVPASATTYSDTTTFFQNPSKNIVIGSEDCDVQLYMIKVYQKHLSNEQHLSNFIMDAPNANEIISRYNRNNILNENGEISYQKLIEKNPNCDVYLYEIPRMTKNKKDKVSGCTYQRFKGKTSPQQTAENVTIAVQGTSSAAYGLAAFNFNSTFESGFTDYSKKEEGEHIDKWAMSENAIPINDFNTKVNVASCEGVNNALNQKFYNDYVPYVTEYQIKNPKSRHTMEFMNMGVLFIKDKNPIDNDSSFGGLGDNVFKDTQGYIANPYYKLYSVCNMGNIKRNEGVFSDPENPYDVIMENPDNQSVYQQMTGVLDENGKLYGAWQGDKFYPYLTENTYIKTEDTTPKSGKVYYQRSGAEGAYSYIQVTGLTEESTVSGLYELLTSGSLATTEVFEWRALPSCWDEMGDRGIAMRREAEDAWTGLVAWFAANNPNAATNEEIPEEHYDAYTFKGYTSRADRLDKDGNLMPTYTPRLQILKGLTIGRYAGTYNRDTYERRMAKMLNECEDHLIMDEIIFHYLFIERHTLIDNVAKNTFWHTEDLQHWSMIKDYDNDTSDGNDNSGHLTLTYGYEVLDHVDHDESQSFVFNAASSVWLHFTNNLLEARTTMFNYLDRSDIGAWDSATYLEEFDKWQSSLPERVWIEDYYRKYLRPKEVYGATQFLPMLEGGKKTHQRRQYETYQEAYMSSEYHGSMCQSSIVDIRANGSNINLMSFPMTMYADCYIRIAAGSGHDANVRYRYHRGETANISLPVTGDANDMTTYFYLANYITSLGNIEMLKPKKVDISAALRLREFSMKALENSMFYSLTEDTVINNNKHYYERVYNQVEIPQEDELTEYYEYNSENNIYIETEDVVLNPEKTYYIFDGYNEVINPTMADLSKYYEQVSTNQNLNLTEASFKNNTMLEKLEIIDCPNATNSLDLTGATNLKYLDVSRSGFPSISLASDAPVETLNLNNPQILSFTNLTKVNTFNIDYSRLNTLYLNNIDNSPNLNSKTLVVNQNNDNLTYNLQNVQWVINDPNEINDTSIKILDKLLEEGNTPYSPLEKNITDKKLALSGTLTITKEAYNNNNSMNLYQKYAVDEATNFPNLNLIFEGNNAKLYTINITDGNNNIVWTKKAQSNYIIDEDFLSSGPNGAFETAKVTHKENTAAKTFTFSNKWQVKNFDTGEELQIIDRTSEEDKSPYINVPINANILITPLFIENVRTYTLTFNVNNESSVINDVPYGTILLNKAEEQFPGGPIISDIDLPLDQTYSFKGWGLHANSAIVINNEVTLQDDVTLFAIFEQKDVHKNIHPEWFTYSNSPEGSPENGLNPIILRPRDDVILSGKVTIPTYFEGHPVVGISGFSKGEDSDPITHIFFENAMNSRVMTIYSNCFYLVNTLIYFEFPYGLQTIQPLSFYGTHLQVDLVPNEINVYDIGNTNLKTIGTNAFQSSLFSNTAGYRIRIPHTVTQIGYAAFGWENGLRNCTFELGTEAHKSEWDVRDNPGYNNTLPTASYEGSGHRFTQNSGYNITLVFFSAKYNSKSQTIAPRDGFSDDEGFTVLNAITSNNNLLIQGNLSD